MTFDFTSGVLDSLVTFTRTHDATSTATYVDRYGATITATNNQPRFDHDPVTLACRGLLIEELRQNVILQSDDLSASPWALTSCSYSSGLLVSAGGGFARQNLTLASSKTYQASFLVKKNTSGSWISVYFRNKDSSNAISWFNMDTGQFSGSVVGTFSAVQWHDGYWRITVSHASGSGATTPFIQIQFSVSSGANGATPGTSFYVKQAQVEEGGFPTSYIPTAASAMTRNPDIAMTTGSNFSDWWQAGKGSALVRARPSTVSGIRPLVQFDDNTADNIIALRGNTTNPELYVRTGGSDQAQIDAGVIAANTSYRLAGAWATNDCAASLNSGSPVLDGVAAIPVVTQARLGSDGTNYLNGHLEAIEYYDERVLNGSLQLVSSAAGYRSIIGSVFRDAIIS
jgi:hypothetical protein